MEGMRFTRNRQNTRSFGKCLVGNPMGQHAPVAAGHVHRHSSACSDIVVLRSPTVPFPDLKHVRTSLSKLKFRVFCYF